MLMHVDLGGMVILNFATEKSCLKLPCLRLPEPSPYPSATVLPHPRLRQPLLSETARYFHLVGDL